MNALHDRHPYLYARDRFLTGQMHTTTAIGMVCEDREFIAECAMASLDVADAARQVVMVRWVAEAVALVAAVQQGHAAWQASK